MNLGATEIVLICLLALILFGGSKLADIGKGLGQGIKNFKQGLRESDAEDNAVEPPKTLPTTQEHSQLTPKNNLKV